MNAADLGGERLSGDEVGRGTQLDLLGGDGDGEHGLAETRGPDEGHRGGLIDEGGVQVPENQLPLQIGPEPEVELLDGGGEREPSLLDALPGLGVEAMSGLDFQEPAEEVDVGQLLSGGAIEVLGKCGSCIGEAELIEEAVQTGYHASPPASVTNSSYWANSRSTSSWTGTSSGRRRSNGDPSSAGRVNASKCSAP